MTDENGVVLRRDIVSVFNTTTTKEHERNCSTNLTKEKTERNCGRKKETMEERKKETTSTEEVDDENNHDALRNMNCNHNTT
jgi:hypothetical protein